MRETEALISTWEFASGNEEMKEESVICTMMHGLTNGIAHDGAENDGDGRIDWTKVKQLPHSA